MDTETKKIYTIGHSTRSLEEFIGLLKTYEIENLVDIRSFPGSRKFPQFNKEDLGPSLEQAGIHYLHDIKLGGRRKVLKDSHNNRWRKDAFKGYADYMETNDFEEGIAELIKISETGLTAYMCSEAVWWRCHRSMVSDHLKAKGWTVLHIMSEKHVEEHPYTQPAIIKDGCVYYSDEIDFNQ